MTLDEQIKALEEQIEGLRRKLSNLKQKRAESLCSYHKDGSSYRAMVKAEILQFGGRTVRNWRIIR